MFVPKMWLTGQRSEIGVCVCVFMCECWNSVLDYILKKTYIVPLD